MISSFLLLVLEVPLEPVAGALEEEEEEEKEVEKKDRAAAERVFFQSSLFVLLTFCSFFCCFASFFAAFLASFSMSSEGEEEAEEEEAEAEAATEARRGRSAGGGMRLVAVVDVEEEEGGASGTAHLLEIDA